MRYYVNLPISWIYNEATWIDFFTERGLNPELGFDRQSMALPADWHRKASALLKSRGLVCAAHLPFFGPLLGQEDAKARAEGVKVLKKAAKIAAIYKAEHLIGHPSFFAHSDGTGPEPRTGDIGPRPSERWLKHSLDGWEEVLSVTDAQLYLENTHDPGPEAVIALLDALSRGDYHSRVGMCFDLGHWFSFAQGCDRDNLLPWLAKIAPYLKHLHLHDNFGHSDEHLGLGKGEIPLEDFFFLLRREGLYPSFTLEPHDLPALQQSLRWMDANPSMVEWMGADQG